MKLVDGLHNLVNQKTISYAFFGILTSLLNIFLFKFLSNLGVPYRTSNLITLIIVKLVSYIVNKIFVFKSEIKGFIPVLKEFFLFMISRAFTMLIDYFGLIFLVEAIHLEPDLSKIILTVLVIIINYFLGDKVFSFTNNTTKKDRPI